jgi:hypothetical protein
VEKFKSAISCSDLDFSHTVRLRSLAPPSQGRLGAASLATPTTGNQELREAAHEKGLRQTTFQPGAAQRSGPFLDDYHHLLNVGVRIAHNLSRQTGAWAPGVSPALPCSTPQIC